MQVQELEFTLEQQMAVFGIQDKNIRVIEQAFPVSIRARNAHIEITGESDTAVKNAVDVLNHLKVLYDRKEEITIDVVYRVVRVCSRTGGDYQSNIRRYVRYRCHRPFTIRPSIKCKPIIGQKNYIKALQQNTVTLCIGPAGTGKTYLAVAQAVADLKDGKIERIIDAVGLAIEAGEERLGFLPGDLAQKVDPYLRPLYDALNDMLVRRVAVQTKIWSAVSSEIAPCWAYVRGLASSQRASIIYR